MIIPAEARQSEVLKGVSRETWERLQTIVDLMLRWNKRINLISRRTESEIWARHILDSAQIVRFAGACKQWVDLGSGGGLPGLIVACVFKEISPGTEVTLIESDTRKTAFLMEASRAADLSVTVEARRIEHPPNHRYDVVSARALAPLPKLLAYAKPYVKNDGICIFMKGESIEAELTEARLDWHMKATTHRSLTDQRGAILCVEELTHA